MKGCDKMTRRGKIVFFISLVILAVVSGIVAYFVTKSNKTPKIADNNNYISEKIEDECTEEYIAEQNTTAVTSVEERVSTNAILILKKYYIQCDHTINEYVELPKELVNMTKEEVQKHYPDWEVIGFEKGKVILYKELDGVCGEHFKLRVENGKVVVYIVDTDGKETLYEKTNISSEYLTETDLINMQDGLEIYGKEELNQIIEDFE